MLAVCGEHRVLVLASAASPQAEQHELLQCILQGSWTAHSVAGRKHLPEGSHQAHHTTAEAVAVMEGGPGNQGSHARLDRGWQHGSSLNERLQSAISRAGTCTATEMRMHCQLEGLQILELCHTAAL